jgi:hypothetical protein
MNRVTGGVETQGRYVAEASGMMTMGTRHQGIHKGVLTE